VAHPEPYQALTEYETRAKRITALALGLWLAAFVYSLLPSSTPPPRLLYALIVGDAVIVVGLGLRAILSRDPGWLRVRACWMPPPPAAVCAMVLSPGRAR
jgi:hypothetical protein